MDSLAQYGDEDDDSDTEIHNNPGLIGPLPPSQSSNPQWNAAPSSPPAQPKYTLPPPDFGDGPSDSHTRYVLYEASHFQIYMFMRCKYPGLGNQLQPRLTSLSVWLQHEWSRQITPHLVDRVIRCCWPRKIVSCFSIHLCELASFSSWNRRAHIQHPCVHLHKYPPTQSNAHGRIGFWCT